VQWDVMRSENAKRACLIIPSQVTQSAALDLERTVKSRLARLLRVAEKIP